MTTLEQAARQALEALEYTTIGTLSGGNDNTKKAIADLRQALEQKPCNPSCAPGYCYCEGMAEQPLPRAFYEKGKLNLLKPTECRMDSFPIYTEPPKREWVGLTDEEIRAIDTSEFWNDNTPLDFARVVEAKLKELNT
jgi:hypothetical protein